MKTLRNVIILSSTLLAIGCFRGTPTDNSPLHLILNMDDQEKFEPFEKNTFFADESAMRMPAPGTIARDDSLLDDSHAGIHNAKNKIALNSAVMERGKQRYEIYCQPCHGAVGDGKGIVAQRGMTQGFVPPTNFHSADMRSKPDGHYYHVITHGIRNMQSYSYQVSENDRWAIIHYIRALQRSQNASLSDVPASMRDKVQ
jgi:mono/diheme cytochrome c family protein